MSIINGRQPFHLRRHAQPMVSRTPSWDPNLRPGNLRITVDGKIFQQILFENPNQMYNGILIVEAIRPKEAVAKASRYAQDA